MTEAAFIVIYHRHYNAVYRNAFRMTRSPLLAEEITQEAFIRIWKKHEDLASIRNIESYLFIIVRNLVFNYHQRQRMVRKAIRELEFTCERVVLPDSEVTEAVYERMADQLLEKLSPRQKEVLRMSKQDGLTHKAIASRLSLSALTVKRHMGNALKEVRKHLSGSHRHP